MGGISSLTLTAFPSYQKAFDKGPRNELLQVKTDKGLPQYLGRVAQDLQPHIATAIEKEKF
jgi:hypothetical protein